MADLSFIWSTNIEDVASKIDKGLARVGQSVKKMGSGGDLGFASGLGSQIERRVQAVANAGAQSMLQAARQLEATVSGSPGKNLGVGGKPVDARSTILGGGFDDPGNVFNQVNRELANMAQDIDRKLVGSPLEGKRAEIQQALQAAGEQVTTQLRVLYQTIAQDMQRATAAARKVGTTGVKTIASVPQSAQLERFARDATVLDRRGRDIDPTVARNRGLLGGDSDIGVDRAATVINSLTEVTRDSIRQEEESQALERRLIQELAANRLPSGALKEPQGARSFSNGRIVRDEAGDFFERQPAIRGAEGEIVQEAYFDDLRRETALEEQEVIAALKRRAQLEDDRRTQDLTALNDGILANKELEAAQKKRRNTLLNLEDQIRQDVGVLGGAGRAGRFLRDRQGDLYEFNDQGKGAQVIPDEVSKTRLDAENAFARKDRQVLAAKERERKAQERIAAKAEQRAAGSGGGGGGGGKFGQFLDRAFGGGEGREGRGLGFDDILTSSLSFSRYLISAAAFGAVFGVLNEVKTALLDYEDSLADLRVALDSTEDVQNSFTNALAQTSRLTGANPGAALDVAARGIRAFTDAADSDVLKQKFGEDFAQAATELAVIAGKDMTDAAGDLIAASTVFEASFNRINDAIASAKQSTGADPDEIAQGLANVGAAAREAGFDLETSAQLIATISARTDQSGNASATRLSRILSIAGGSAGQSAIANLNAQAGTSIDQSAPVASQLAQLAGAYDNLTASQQAYIRNSVGGAANSREFVTLINEFDSILANTQKSYEESGEAAKQFNVQINNLRSTVDKIVGSLKNIVVQLAEAGAFDVFIGAIKLTEPFLQLLERVLQLYNMLPRALKSVVAILATYIGAQKLLGEIKRRTNAETAIEISQEGALAAARQRTIAASLGEAATGFIGPRRGGRLGRGSTGAAVTDLGQSIVFPQGTFGSSIKNRRGGVAGDIFRGVAREIGDGLKNVFTKIGEFLKTGLGKLSVAIGGALLVQQFARTSAAQRTALNSRDEVLRDGVTPGRLRDQIANRQEAAEELRDASGGIVGTIVDALTGGAGKSGAADLDATVEGLNAAAKSIEDAVNESLRAGTDADLIDLSSPDGISEGLKTLEDNGRSATSRMQSLREAIRNLGEEARDTASGLTGRDRIEFERLLGPRLGESILRETGTQDALGGRGRFTDFIATLIPGSFLNRDGFSNGVANLFGDKGNRDFSDVLSQLEVDNADIQSLAADFLTSTGGRFNPEDQESFSGLLQDLLVQGVDLDSLDPEQTAALEAFIEQEVNATTDAVRDVVDEYIAVSTLIAEGLKLAQAVADEAKLSASLSGDARGGELAGAQTAVQQYEQLLADARAAGASEEQLMLLQNERDTALLDLQKAQSNRIQSTIKLQQSQLNESLDLESLRLEIEGAEQRLSIATDAVEKEGIQAELNALSREEENLVLARVQAARKASIDPRDTVGQTQNAIREIREQLNVLRSRGDTQSTEFFGLQEQLRAELLADVQNRIARGAARRLASVDPRDSIGEARANLSTTIQSLEAALPGTEEYYTLLRQVKSEQLALAEQEAELANARSRATSDPRSALETARNDLEAARRGLALTLPGTIEYFNQLASLNDAQIGFSQAVRDAASLARQVDIDLTNPVATTAEALLTAQQNLSAALSEGAPQDVLDQLRIEEQNAQASAEAAAFQQRFNDARVARDLGRISHLEYLAYLNEEAARLRAVADRTRQQQEQLDSVEQAIKAANDALSGQFNLGDINVPTPFEARRSVAEQFGSNGVGASSVVNNQTTTIYIDGTDLAAVQKILEQSVGQRAVRRYSGTGPRT